MKLTNNKGGLLVAAAVTVGLATLLITNDFINGNGWEDVDRQGVTVEDTSAQVGTAYWRP